MNYRKITSRLGGLTKINVSLALIATCVWAVLLVMGVPPPYPAHAQESKSTSLSGGPPSAILAASTPEPYFSVTWTAEATSHFRDGATVMNRQVIFAGNAVVRRLDNLPFGAQDNFPFEMTTSDDSDGVVTYPCHLSPKTYRSQTRFFIRDTDRYSNIGPIEGLYVTGPFQMNGEWVILDPFHNIFSNFEFPYLYRSITETINCDRPNHFSDSSGDSNGWRSSAVGRN